MQYTKINSAILAAIENAIGASNVFVDDDSLANYAHDETEDLKYFPEVVVKPDNTAGVSASGYATGRRHWLERCCVANFWRRFIVNGKVQIHY